MKKLLLITIFLIVGVLKAQNKESTVHDQIDEKFEKYMKMADSMNYKSDSLTYRLDVINKIDFFRDKLLLSDNFKNQARAYDIMASFSKLVNKDFDYSKVTKDDVTINKFFRLQKSFFKSKVNKEIVEYYYNKKMENISDNILKEQELIEAKENRIISTLQKANYPIEKFNKLSSEEKENLLKELEEKH